MVVVHLRPNGKVMPAPSSARIVTIKAVPPRPAPTAQLLQRSRWQCAICGKLLSSKRSYDEHLNIHNEARPFTCDHCEYAAASQMTLRRHILRKHASRDDWHYKCPYCGEAYMEPASYQQHVSSRHFGRSATFGCQYTSCTFQTKCSKHFKEHLIKHHNCPSAKRMKTGDGLSMSSGRDDELIQFLVDDDLGVGFSRRSEVVTRPIIRTNGEVGRVIAVTTSSTGGLSTTASGVSSRGGSEINATSHVGPTAHPPQPQRRMVVLRKVEKRPHEDTMQSLPSTSTGPPCVPSCLTVCTSVPPLPAPLPSLLHAPPPPSSVAFASSPLPPSLPAPPAPPLLHASLPLRAAAAGDELLRVADDDFMKAPIALRRTLAPPPRMPQQQQLLQLQHRKVARRQPLPPQPPITTTTPHLMRVGGGGGGGGKVKGGGRGGALVVERERTATLGGARHAPAMISADDWIEHEEIVEEEAAVVYADGSVDFECD